MWDLCPPPDFQGLRPDRPLTMYHRKLPHWRQDGATYFVTFHLADSLPKKVKLDGEHLWRVIQYIGSSLQRARLDIENCPLWIRPQWLELGWRLAATEGTSVPATS